MAAEFKCESEAAAEARAYIGAALRVWHLDDLAEVAKLLTSELVANAVIHARSAIRLEAHREPSEVVIQVFDDSPELPVQSDAAPDAEGGRGLYLVDQLASRWGAEPAELGKVVWFSLPAAS